MKKRGYGHIEIIISFVLFVGVVGATIYLIDPFDNSSSKSYNLKYALDGLKDNASIEIETYTLQIKASNNPPGGGPPAGVGPTVTFYEFNYNGDLKNKNVIVKDLNNMNVVCEVSKNEKRIKLGSLPSMIFIGPSDNIKTNCNTNLIGNGGNTEIINYNLEKVISEKILDDLKEMNKIELNRGIGLPLDVDLNYKLSDNNGVEIVERAQEIPEGIEIYTDIERIEVVKENGQRYFANLEVKIW